MECYSNGTSNLMGCWLDTCTTYLSRKCDFQKNHVSHAGLQNVQQMWVARPEPIAGCPPGLEYLTMVDQLLVKQQIELLEGLCYAINHLL